jgi:hypothetical protein
MTQINQTDQDYATGLRLWRAWTTMWNTRPELAHEIVSSKFVLHLMSPSPLDTSKVRTPADVERWVIAHRATFKRLVFHDPGVGPFVDTRAGVVAGPWIAEASLDGSERWVCGMDTIAFTTGKISEYWTTSKETDAVGRWAQRG